MPKNRFKYYCATEGKYIKENIEDGNQKPSVCKNDVNHTVDWTSLSYDKRAQNKESIGLTNIQNTKNNQNAIVNPVTTDDINNGYTPGSKWLNINNQKEFTCIDNSANTALWIELTQTIYNFIFMTNANNPYIKTNAKSYKTIGTFGYKNTVTISSFEIIADVAKNTGYARIYDTINNQIICETSFTNTDKQIINLGTVSYLPNSDSIFEIQLKSQKGNIHIYALSAY